LCHHIHEDYRLRLGSTKSGARYVSHISTRQNKHTYIHIPISNQSPKILNIERKKKKRKKDPTYGNDVATHDLRLRRRAEVENAWTPPRSPPR